MNRIVPKNTKTKNTVWRSWGIVDIIVALVLFVIVFVLLSTGCYVWFGIMLVVTVVLLIPTQDGIVYMILYGLVKYWFTPKEYSKKLTGKKNVLTLLPLKSIKANGLIKYTDGTYARVIHLGQKNFGMLSSDDQSFDIGVFANALQLLNLNQSADLVKVEKEVNLDSFSETIDMRIAAEDDVPDSDPTKKTRLGILEDRKRQLKFMGSQNQKYISEYYLVIYGKDKNDIDNISLAICSEIRRCEISVDLLDGLETAIFLKNTFTREFDPHEAAGKTSKELVDWILPDKVTFNSHGVVVDGVTQTITAVSDYPTTVGNAWGANLFDMADTKVVLHIRPVERTKAVKRIDKCVSNSEVKSLTANKASEGSTAEAQRDTMMELLEALQQSGEVLFDTSLMVTAYNYEDTATTEMKLKVKRAFSGEKFRTTNLYAMQQQAFMLSCPRMYEKFTNYDRGINSSCVAAVFPFVRCYLADDDGIFLGSARAGAYPFILNIWKRSGSYQNSNAMIIGKSGSGKSYFMKSFLTGEWSQGTRIMILDPENEYNYLTKNLNGNLIDVGNSREGRINPFHIYKILTDEGTPAEPAVTFNTHLKTLESFFRIVFEGITADILEMINNLTVETYAMRGIMESTDFSSLPPEAFPTFSDLYEVVNDKEKLGPDEITQRQLRTIKLFLQKFVTGRYSDIWNGPSTLNVNGNMVDFNFQSLFANKNNIVANAQMLLVFRYIEQEVINGREKLRRGEDLKTLILVDEAHLFIDAKYPVALDFFYSMCKRIRKYNGAFMPATQNIADWNATEELRSKTTAILKNSQYTFVFKLAAPDVADLVKLYKFGDGFNDTEQRAIVSYHTGSALFIGSSEFRTTMIVRTSPYVISLFTEKAVPDLPEGADSDSEYEEGKETR